MEKRALRRLRIAVAVTILSALLFPAYASAVPGALRWGILDASPTGYMGCHVGVGAARFDHYSCVVAYEIEEGVKVIYIGRGDSVLLPNGARFYQAYVEEVTAPSANMTVLTAPNRSIPGVELEVDLPRTGHVYLRAWSFSGFYAVEGVQGGCGITLNYNLLTTNRDRVMGNRPYVTGTVDGTPVKDEDQCGTYFWGATSGPWELFTAPEEGTFSSL